MTEIRLQVARTTVVFDDERPLRKKAGRFSTVYAGKTEWSGRKVIVKKLRKTVSRRERFLHLYERLRMVRHPALQPVYGVVEHEEDMFVVSGYAEGADLKEILAKKGRFRDLRKVRRVVLDLLSGLDVLHRRGLVHADIKPANIILEEERGGRAHAVLIDPGEAVVAGDPQNGGKKPFALMYSPPEQVLGFTELINASSDLYSLGVVMWEMLSGHRPFHATHPAAVINLQLNVPLAKNGRIPEAWYRVIARATAKTAFPKPPSYYTRQETVEMLTAGQKKRYPTSREMMEDVKNINI